MYRAIKNGACGIGISMIISGFVSVIFDLLGNGTFIVDNYGMTKMIFACLLVGLGFGVPSAIYDVERIPRLLQMVIHMGIGISVYLIVAFMVGWIPVKLGVPICACIVAGQLVISFIIWLLISLYYKREVKRLNDRLQVIKNK